MVMRYVVFIIILSLLVCKDDFVNSARILAIVPTPSYSHQLPFYPLWRALAKRGHDITLLTTDPMELDDIQNIRQINLKSTYDVLDKIGFKTLISSGSVGLLEFVPTITDMFTKVAEDILTNTDVHALINNKEEYFDLAMVETFFPTAVVFAERFKCPFIGINSNDAFGFIHAILGNPVHPIMYPEAIIPYEKETTLLMRLQNTFIMTAMDAFVKYGVMPKQDDLVKKYFGDDYPRIEETLKNMSLLFIVGDSFLQNVRPVGPSTIYIGGTSHIGKPKPLPEDLQQFLDSAKEGAIYFSLGSNVKSENIPEEKRAIIIDVLSKLPYKVLWKFEADQLEDKPDNVKITKWAPQHDVLNHPNIKLFITQGGFQSLQETVYFHVPVLVIPFMGDQASNARRAVDQGLGLTLKIDTITPQTFKEAILEIIKNEKYRNRVKELSQIIQDQPMSGLDKAVWWTEYVIRNKGAKHLVNPAAETPFYQQYLLDVFAVFSILIITVLYTIQRIVRYILKGVFIMISTKKKVKTVRKKVKSS